MKKLKTIAITLGALFSTGFISAAAMGIIPTPFTETPKTNDALQSSRLEAANLKDAEPISILLAGLDSGAMMYADEENGRTDALIVVTMNPEKEQTTITSIPRDTWMPIDDEQKFDKINHAYVYGGIEASHNAVEQYLGIPIDYYLTVDMKAFIDTVDNLDGLEMTPNQSFEESGDTFVEGTRKTFNGEQVINYARMRKKDENGEMGRQERQRQVIDEMMNQYMTLSTIKDLPKLYKTFNEHADTNLDVSDALQLFQQYKPSLENIKNVPFTQYTNINKNGVYYMYIDDMHRNTIHKTLSQNLDVTNEFTPIIYPTAQVPDQPYTESQLYNIQPGAYNIDELGQLITNLNGY